MLSVSNLEEENNEYITVRTPKPIPLTVIPENIPDELTSQPRWLLWAYEWTRGKWTKVPYSPLTLEDNSLSWAERKASSTCPDTWSTFDKAMALYRKYAPAGEYVDGIGFAMGCGLVGIDVDHCIEPDGSYTKNAQNIMRRAGDTYAEISPSGKGLRIICLGKLPQDKGRKIRNPQKKEICEIYSTARYLTFTGHKLSDAKKHFLQKQYLIDTLLRLDRLAKPKKSKVTTSTLVTCLPIEDARILTLARSAKNADKFNQLWAGDDAPLVALGYTKPDGSADHSSADQALCNLLAFYTGDFNQIDRLFSVSGLYRDKWDRADYKQSTIGNAIAMREAGNVYAGGQGERLAALEQQVNLICYEVPDPIPAGDGTIQELPEQPAVPSPDDEFIRLAVEHTADQAESGYAVKIDPKDPKRFEIIADSFLFAHKDKFLTHLRFADKGMTFAYTGTHYKEFLNVNILLRKFLTKINVPQSNIVISNVVPIIEERALAECDKPLPFWKGEQFSKPSNTIAFTNAILDIESGSVFKHTPQWCSGVCMPFAYTPAATCPVWLDFLSVSLEGDAQRIALLQEYMGYLMTSDISAHKALMMYGKPRSGKGTIQRVISSLIGPSCCGYSIDRLATDFGLAPLVNKSVALVGEIELAGVGNRAKIVEILKGITGGDEQMINKKHDGSFPSMVLPTRFVFATNMLPRLMDSTGALACRLLFLPFEVSFAGREDMDLERKLQAELPGIASWAIEGLRRLRANGKRFTLGTGHHDAMREFKGETSPLINWLQDCMLVSTWADPGDLQKSSLTTATISVDCDAAFKSFAAWCDDNALADQSEANSAKWFGKNLSNLLPKVKRAKQKNDITGERKWAYRGLGFRL